MRIYTPVFVVFLASISVIAACGSDDQFIESARVAPTRTSRIPLEISSPSVYDLPGSSYNTPNDEAFDDVFFREYGVNPFISTEDMQFSTFGLDVDTASYTIARSYLEEGHLPPPEAVRVEEFVNYFRPDYPAPDEAIQVFVDGARSRFGEDNKHLVRIGVAAREIGLDERSPVALTFVIDVSGSMNKQNRLGLAKRSLERLVDQLTSQDEVGIVVYGSNARVILEPTSSKRAILRAIDRLEPEGATNAEAGLSLGYELASDNFQGRKNNRVILISDGVANIGKTAHDSILRRIEREANNAITLTAIGVGMGNYNDILMEQLADNGDGNYFYIDSDSEARQLFTTDLVGLLEPVALDAKIQVEFNPDVVDRYRLIGYENRALETEDFRDDTVDAGEVGAGHIVTALYELRIRDRADGEIATVSIRYEDAETGEVVEQRARIAVDKVDQSFRSASPEFRFIASVAEFAEILRNSYWAEEGTMGEALDEATQAVREMEGGDREDEFVSLVRTAIRLND